MIITTSLRENESLIARAQELASELGADYQPRRKLCLYPNVWNDLAPFIFYIRTDCLLSMQMPVSWTFHPDTAVLRLKGST